MSRIRKSNLRLRFPSGQSGSVLLLVVWMLALLSIGVYAASKNSFFALSAMERIEKDIRAYPLARAGIPFAAQMLADDEKPEFDALSDPVLALSAAESIQVLGEGQFEIFHEFPDPYSGRIEKTPGLLDEERKLNLNRADTDILTSLLRARVSLKEEVLFALVDSIEDWRDEDSEERKYGAEKYDYQSLKKPYDCKNGPFESVDELMLVKGMTPQILDKIRPYLTVHGAGHVNLNTAHPLVLQALGLSEGSANLIMAYRLGPDGEKGTADDPVIATTQAIQGELGLFLGAEELNRLERLVKDEKVGVSSEAYSFTSLGKLNENGYEYRIDVTMKRDGEILFWREG